MSRQEREGFPHRFVIVYPAEISNVYHVSNTFWLIVKTYWKHKEFTVRTLRLMLLAKAIAVNMRAIAWRGWIREDVAMIVERDAGALQSWKRVL